MGNYMPSEIKQQEYFDGDKVNKAEILDKTIEIVDFKAMPSKYKGQYAMIQALFDGRLITVIGNGFMLKQLHQIRKDKFPIKLKFNRKDNYFRLVREDVI